MFWQRVPVTLMDMDAETIGHRGKKKLAKESYKRHKTYSLLTVAAAAPDLKFCMFTHRTTDRVFLLYVIRYRHHKWSTSAINSTFMPAYRWTPIHVLWSISFSLLYTEKHDQRFKVRLRRACFHYHWERNLLLALLLLNQSNRFLIKLEAKWSILTDSSCEKHQRSPADQKYNQTHESIASSVYQDVTWVIKHDVAMSKRVVCIIYSVCACVCALE